MRQRTCSSDSAASKRARRTGGQQFGSGDVEPATGGQTERPHFPLQTLLHRSFTAR